MSVEEKIFVVVLSRWKYIYSAVLEYKFEVLVFHLSMLISRYFILLLQYISEGNIVLFTSLHLSDNFGYFYTVRSIIQSIINK